VGLDGRAALQSGFLLDLDALRLVVKYRLYVTTRFSDIQIGIHTTLELSTTPIDMHISHLLFNLVILTIAKIDTFLT